MKDDRGFSLVELMIVVAIMGVMGSFIFIGLPLLTGQNARECANNMSAALGKEKNYALTRSGTIDCYMELMLDSDGYHVKYYIPKDAVVTGRNGAGANKPEDWVLAEEQKIGSRTVNVVCSFDDGTTVNITDGQSVKLIYNRTNGEFKNAVKSDGSEVGNLDSGTTPCVGITFESGRKYEITLYPATGKHVLSKVN